MTDDLAVPFVIERREQLRAICRRAIAGGDVTKAELRLATMKYVCTQGDNPRRVLERLYRDEGELGSSLRKAVGIVSKQLDDREYSPSTGAAYPRNRWYLDLLRDPDDIDEDDREDDDDDDDVEKQTDHHASVVANLLVESGRFGSRSEALHHLLHKPGGRALLASLHKAAETAKESTMKTRELRDIAKGGIHAIAKAMTDENRGYGITEHEFVDLIGKHDPRPGESEAQTFTRHYTAQTADSLMLRKAHALTKGVANLTPTMVGGPDAMREAVDNTEQSEAYAKLEGMAERMRATSPWLSAAQAFSAVFQEPKNAKLAASAHRRPSAASTSYPFPSVR